MGIFDFMDDVPVLGDIGNGVEDTFNAGTNIVGKVGSGAGSIFDNLINVTGKFGNAAGNIADGVGGFLGNSGKFTLALYVAGAFIVYRIVKN